MNLFYRIGCISLICLATACVSKKESVTKNYYFDAAAGNDSSTGLSESQALKSLSRIKILNLKPGDSVLLKSGVVFNEQLYISCKGAADSPIVVSKYGGVARPYIKGDSGKMQSVHVFNSEYIIIRDLEISNKGEKPIDGLNGILVELLNYGTAKNTVLDNLYIHDVYGILVRDGKGGGNGIMLRNYRDDKIDTVSSRFDSLRVENCLVENCQRNGIMMWGNWIRKNWNPSTHVVIRNNMIDGIPGDGIVPVACDSPLVEYNIMRNCPTTLPPSEACDGIWPWSCDNAIIQYNIVSDHKSQVDGYGFDSDWNSNNSLFQYNLSYNNDGGFLLICNSGGWTPDWSIGNRGTIIRYNISINDGLRDYVVPKSKRKYFSPVIHMTGPVKNSLIEKNLFYIYKKPKPEIDRTIVSLTDWGGYPDSTFFKGNYIYSEEPQLAIDPTKSTGNYFADNRFIGPVSVPASGFIPYNGVFNRQMWYDENDKHWDKLLEFVGDKSIPIGGRELKVKDIIGFTQTNK